MGQGFAGKAPLARRERHLLKRVALVALLALMSLVASASPAGAAVTLGSTAVPSGSVPGMCSGAAVDAQLTDDPSAPYFAPGVGKITQWQTNTSLDTAGQPLTFVVLKSVGGGSFNVVGVDERTLPSPLPPGEVATFQLAAPIAVTAGETLGLTSAAGAMCFWQAGAVPVESTLTALSFPGPLAPNLTLTPAETSPGGFTMNLGATFIPDNNIVTLGKAERNTKKGTATLNLNLPNPGELTASGNGVKAASARAVLSKSVPAGPAQLLIKAGGKKKRKLNETGKVSLNVAITYTPTNGDPGTRSVKVKLIKR